MKKLWLVALGLFAFAVYAYSHPHPPAKFYDVTAHKVLDRTQLAQALTQSRIVLVGEHHSNEDHHAGQLDVIKALREAGRKVAVGMEMFRNDSQASLDKWSRGEMPLEEFQPIYYDPNGAKKFYRIILNKRQIGLQRIVGTNLQSPIGRVIKCKSDHRNTAGIRFLPKFS